MTHNTLQTQVNDMAQVTSENWLAGVEAAGAEAVTCMAFSIVGLKYGVTFNI